MQVDKIIAVSDAIARAFKKYITEGKDGKEVLRVPVSAKAENGFLIPNPKFDRGDWHIFKEALKFRHKLEAFYQPSNNVMVCTYGHLSGAPEITEEEVDHAIKAFAVAEEVATEQYDALLKRLK